MKKIILIYIISLLCIYAKAQEKGRVGFSYSEISVECISRDYDKKPFCTLIQSEEEFKKICINGKITQNIAGRPLERKIKYSQEVILHVFYDHSFKYDAWYDEDTNIIHFFVYYIRTWMTTRENTEEKRRERIENISQIWFAIQKPSNGYQVHFHLIDEKNKEEVKVFKSIK